MGTTGTIVGTAKYLKSMNPRNKNNWSSARRGIINSRNKKMAKRIHTKNL
jgi:cysteine synthase